MSSTKKRRGRSSGLKEDTPSTPPPNIGHGPSPTPTTFTPSDTDGSSSNSTPSTAGSSDQRISAMLSSSPVDQSTPQTTPGTSPDSARDIADDPHAEPQSPSPPQKALPRAFGGNTTTADDSTVKDASTTTDDSTVEDGSSLDKNPPKCCDFKLFGDREMKLQALDVEIAQHLSDGPYKNKSKTKMNAEADPTDGYAYVALRYCCEHFAKIGSTKESISSRLRDVSPKLVSAANSNTKRIYFFTFAEKTAHLELYNIQYEVRSKSSDKSDKSPKNEQAHTEYFNIQTDKVNDIVDKWTKWLDTCEPYDKDGKLTPFWSHRINNRQKFDDTKTAADLHGRWKTVLSKPTRWERAEFLIRNPRSCLSRKMPLTVSMV